MSSLHDRLLQALNRDARMIMSICTGFGLYIISDFKSRMKELEDSFFEVQIKYDHDRRYPIAWNMVEVMTW